MGWAAHRHAPTYLAGLSFAESSFFPIPPDVMLAPMALATPKRAWFYAALTTLASALGGVAGYLLGMFAFEMIAPLLRSYGYWEGFLRVQDWFDKWGFWAIFIAGFTPVPYKLFTISAGLIAMPFIPFLVASVIGRGARFYLVSALMVWGGERMQNMVRTYIDRIGWLVIVAAVILFLLLRS
jgi:membrane protein YqaA with SNARE-associated domain